MHWTVIARLLVLALSIALGAAGLIDEKIARQIREDSELIEAVALGLSALGLVVYGAWYAIAKHFGKPT